MTTFICYSLFLLLSGFKNALYYRGDIRSSGIAVIGMLIVNAGYMLAFCEIWPYNLLMLLIGFTTVEMYGRVLLPGYTPLVHGRENLLRALFAIAAVISGADIYQLITATLFGNALFNQVIRTGRALDKGQPYKEAVLAYWRTTRKDRLKYAKGNWFSFLMLPGKVEVITGIIAAAVSVYLYSQHIYWNLVKW